MTRSILFSLSLFTAVNSWATVDPQTLTFGEQALNTSSTAQAITVTNNTLSRISISDMSVTNSNDFSIAGTSSCKISGTVSSTGCKVDVIFTPTAAGSRSTALTIKYSDNTQDVVQITGAGKASASALLGVSGTGAFGDVTINTEKVETITVKNTGTADISDLKLEISGTGFSQTSTSCNTTLVKTTGQCTVDVAFKPTQVGDSNGTLTITATGADGSPQTVALSGKGTAAPLPVINVTPTSLTFGATNLSQKVTINNTTANTTLKVSSAFLSGTGIAKFSNSGCENAQLTTNTCEITVTFADPKDGQTFNASLDITSDGGSKSVSLSATASPPVSVCSETRLDACTTQVDCESKTNSKGLWNTAAQTPICIAKPDLTQLSALAINVKNGVLAEPKAMLFGGAKKGNIISQEFLVEETISIDGFIIPEASHLKNDKGEAIDVDILVLGRYLAALPAGKTEDDCDPKFGDYYVNVNNGDYRDNYCTWDLTGTTQQHGCNTPNNLVSNLLLPTTRRSINVDSYWTRWNGKLDGLKPLARGKLSERTELKGLYMDTLNYTGYVCINFGYRLDDGKIIFNGEPIKYHVNPAAKPPISNNVPPDRL